MMDAAVSSGSRPRSPLRSAGHGRHHHPNDGAALPPSSPSQQGGGGIMARARGLVRRRPVESISTSPSPPPPAGPRDHQSHQHGQQSHQGHHQQSHQHGQQQPQRRRPQSATRMRQLQSQQMRRSGAAAGIGVAGGASPGPGPDRSGGGGKQQRHEHIRRSRPSPSSSPRRTRDQHHHSSTAAAGGGAAAPPSPSRSSPPRTRGGGVPPHIAHQSNGTADKQQHQHHQRRPGGGGGGRQPPPPPSPPPPPQQQQQQPRGAASGMTSPGSGSSSERILTAREVYANRQRQQGPGAGAGAGAGPESLRKMREESRRKLGLLVGAGAGGSSRGVAGGYTSKKKIGSKARIGESRAEMHVRNHRRRVEKEEEEGEEEAPDANKSDKSKLSDSSKQSNKSIALSEKSVSRGGGLAQVRNVSLRTAHEMPTTVATLHVGQDHHAQDRQDRQDQDRQDHDHDHDDEDHHLKAASHPPPPPPPAAGNSRELSVTNMFDWSHPTEDLNQQSTSSRQQQQQVDHRPRKIDKEGQGQGQGQGQGDDQKAPQEPEPASRATSGATSGSASEAASGDENKDKLAALPAMHGPLTTKRSSVETARTNASQSSAKRSSSTTKRSSVQTVHTNASQSTAAADNLTSSARNVLQADVDRRAKRQEAQAQAHHSGSVMRSVTSDSTEPAANTNTNTRASSDNDSYRQFVAKASSRKKIVGDIPAGAPTSQSQPQVPAEPSATSLSEHSRVSMPESDISEFNRFLTEAAEFGKRSLIADAVAGLDDDEAKTNKAGARAEVEDKKDKDDAERPDLPAGEEGQPESPTLQQPHQQKQDDAPPPPPQRVAQAAAAPQPSPPRPQGQRRPAPPPRATSQQRRSVRQRPGRGRPPPFRETDTVRTVADANDSIFPSPVSLDDHIAKDRPPPRMVTTRGGSMSSSISSLSKPLPDYKKKGRMGRLLRRKKKKTKDKRYQSFSGAPPSRGMPRSASTKKSRQRLTTILSLRLVQAMHGSFTSDRQLGSSHHSDLKDTSSSHRGSHLSELNTVKTRPPTAGASSDHKQAPAAVAKPLDTSQHAAVQDEVSAESGASANVNKGGKMVLRWKQLGVDIATKQLDAAQVYYNSGDLERARKCYAQVAAMDRPLEGDDDATVVLHGLVGEAKSMLVRIDKFQSIGQLEDDVEPEPVVESPMSDASADLEVAATAAAAATTIGSAPTIAQIPKDVARDDESQKDSRGTSTPSSDIFLSVRDTFFSTDAAEGDDSLFVATSTTTSSKTDTEGDTPIVTAAAAAKAEPEQSEVISIDSDGFPATGGAMSQSTEDTSTKLKDFLDEASVQPEDPDARRAYTPKDIEDMANDLASMRSEGHSRHSSITSIDPEDIDGLDAFSDDEDEVEESNDSPPGFSDKVVIHGQPNDVDSSLPSILTKLQKAGVSYTIPMAPPSGQGLLHSDSTLSDSYVSPHHPRSAIDPSNGRPSTDQEPDPLMLTMKAVGEAREIAQATSFEHEDSSRTNSQQSAGSDTAEIREGKPMELSGPESSGPESSGPEDDSSYGLPRGYDDIDSESEAETVEEPPLDIEAETSPVQIVKKEQAMAITKIQERQSAVPTPSGEETTEPQPKSGNEVVAAAAAATPEAAEDAAEPIIYCRHDSSGASVVSDMIESTASSWLKQQANSSSRETSSSSKPDGTNPSLTIVGEELLIEDGLDPTEQLRRASEQLEKEVDAAEREAEKRSREKKNRRNAKHSKRLYDQGLVYYAEGAFEPARSCFASALKMRFGSLGQANIDVCLTQEKLGDTLVKLDKIEEAHWQYLMAFRGLQQCNLPKDNPHTARILVSLGDVFFSAADFSRALKYYEKSIRFRAETDSSDVRIGLKKCAVAHEAMAKDEWSKAEVDMCRFHVREMLWLMTYESPSARSFFEAEVKAKKPAANNQKLVVDTGVELVPVSSSSEEDEDTSFSYIEESKALLRRKGSTCTDFDIVRVLDSTAHIHSERKELVNAYKCYLEKLNFLRAKFPHKKKGMAEAAYEVGSTCSKMGRHVEAISYLSEALNLHQRSRSKDEEKIALLLKCLGSAYLSVKNPILALVHFKEHQALCGMGGEKELLSIMGISRGKQYDLPRSLDCYAKVMDMEAKEDQWLAQHNPLGPLIETLEQIFASKTPANFRKSANEKAKDCKDLKTILINLGLAQLIRNPKSAQPSDYIRDLVHYLNEDGCIDGVDFTQVLFSMGNILLRRNRYRESIVYYEKCIASFSDEERDASKDYVDLLTNLGTAFLRNGDHDKSFIQFRSALKEVKRARRRGSGASNSDQFDGLNHFSLLLHETRARAMGRENDEDVLNLRHIIALYLCMDCRTGEAIEVLLDVEKRMIKLVGEDHPDIIQLRVDISTAYLLNGDARTARETYEKAIGPVASGRIPEYHPFYMQYNRLVQIHYPTPVPVVAAPVLKEIPRRRDYTPRVA